MNQREKSREDFTAESSYESINSGSLQRIADACEKMAASYDSVRNDRDLYKRWYEERGRAIDYLNKRIASLRGVITKMKKKQP